MAGQPLIFLQQKGQLWYSLRIYACFEVNMVAEEAGSTVTSEYHLRY